MIVSASRRCDLPAYRLGALMGWIRAGKAISRNPFAPDRIREVSLRPGELECLVLWTRDVRPLLSAVGELEDRGIPFYVQTTLTGYPAALEPGAPPLREELAALRALAQRIGPRRLIWRYDPLFLARSLRGELPELDPAFHLENFRRLAQALEGTTRRVVVSLLDEYRFTGTRLARAGYAEPSYGSPRLRDEAAGEPAISPALLELLRSIADIARDRGMEARSCAEPVLLAAVGIAPGACIDSRLIAELFGSPRPGQPELFETAEPESRAGLPPPKAEGLPQPRKRDPGQRRGCGCASSVDIGDYGACPTGCVYCYARR